MFLHKLLWTILLAAFLVTGSCRRSTQTQTDSKPWVSSDQEEDNLLFNPVFDTVGPNGRVPRGWHLDRSLGDISIEEEDSLRVVRITNRDETHWKFLWQEIPCRGGITYTASVMYKGDRPGLLACFDGISWQNLLLEPGLTWMEYRYEVHTDPSAVRLTFKLGPTDHEEGTGTGFFASPCLVEGVVEETLRLEDDLDLVSREQTYDLARQARGKVIFIGIDGATWDILLPMIAKGTLPNLERLVRSGSYGVLRSQAPTISPALWTTMATGHDREEHGIDDFVVHLPGASRMLPVTSTLRRKEALWTILSSLDQPVGVAGWWATWPPENVQGFVISDRFHFPHMTNTSHPDEIVPLVKVYEPKEIIDMGYLDRFGDLPLSFVEHGNPTTILERRVALLLLFLVRDVSLTDAFLACYERTQPKYAFVYLYGVDGSGHLFWKYHQPISGKGVFDVDPKERALFSRVVEAYYEVTDSLLGKILDKLEGATFLVCSDHGFGPEFREHKVMPDVNYVLNCLGYYEEEGKEKQVVWSKTTLMDKQMNWLPDRMLYANLKGREPEGIVDSKALPNLLQNACDQLKALRGVETDVPLFEEVTLAEETAGREGPEILARVNSELSQSDEILIQDKRVPVSDILPYLDRSGGHIDELQGIIIMSGPKIKQGKIIEGAGVIDVAPTFLALAGLPQGLDMPGEALTHYMTDEHLEAFPLRFVETYEPVEDKKIYPIASEADRAITDHLKDLGYLR